MCGIVGAIARDNVTAALLEGLRRLEYRGYDSAGLATIDTAGHLCGRRSVGKVAQLVTRLQSAPCDGHIGIAHSRWATHGGVTEANAHPHFSPSPQSGRIAVVHNGIIENHEEIRQELLGQGYVFASETDTEVIAHLIHRSLQKNSDLAGAVRQVVHRLRGAYAIAVIDALQPDRLVVARIASPLVIGLGVDANYAASDIAALLPITQRFIYLEEGDIAELGRDSIRVTDAQDNEQQRQIHDVGIHQDATEKGAYRHFMLKEIYEQPAALANTLMGRIADDHLLTESLGPQASELLTATQHVHIVACGTSYHAGCVAKYWIEALAGIPCQVELASEYRYRSVVVPPNTLFVTLSQSGETADTLAALAFARGAGYLARLTVCNSARSSMVRESDFAMLTQAGPEIGVASTKAFTTQLLAMLTVATMLGSCHGLAAERQAEITRSLNAAPGAVEQVLRMDAEIQRLAEHFVEKHHALFLGRGVMYPIAMEGALKLKEISYIHAEAYAAGELKHGPLALIDEEMPVVVVAPNHALLDKLKSNMQQVRARGGQLYVLAEDSAGIDSEPGVERLVMPPVETAIAPIVYTVPLQLLAYHVAVLKGTDVDQPRNLAKSVTVE